jgi:hypothetical protein
MPKFFAKRRPASGKAKARVFKKSIPSNSSLKTNGADPLALLSDVIPEEKYRERDLVPSQVYFFCLLRLVLRLLMGLMGGFADNGNTAKQAIFSQPFKVFLILLATAMCVRAAKFVSDSGMRQQDVAKSTGGNYKG